MTVIVTPKHATAFTLHMRGIHVPAQGECGYDSAVSFAKKLLTDERPVVQSWKTHYFTVDGGGSDGIGGEVWIDENGDHFGGLDVMGMSYNTQMLQAGFATVDLRSYLTIDPSPTASVNITTTKLLDAQKMGQESVLFNLWDDCPDFGK